MNEIRADNDVAAKEPRDSRARTPAAQLGRLQISDFDNTVAPATPEKRKRGKCMSRRSQVGSIEISGKWYVVRYWKDVPGQDRRVHACERICLKDGPATLNATEREREALKIVMRSGVNDAQQFIESTSAVTFREQAANFMKTKIHSKRKPLKPATHAGWQCCLVNWLLPNLGDLPLAKVNNAALKNLVTTLHDGGLSAQTIVTYTNLAKLVVASAKNEEGEALFPRKWDSEFMDLPIIGEQHQPKFSASEIAAIIDSASGQERMLYALLAGTGMRIGEALGLEIGRHVSSDCRALFIRQSVWEGARQEPKTKSAKRDVDLCPELVTALKAFVGERESGYLFANRMGNAMLQTNVLKRSLYPILETLNIGKAGFHAFRRFRATHLSKSRVPDSLMRFWLGHSNRTVTDEYVKLFDDVNYRQTVADTIGLGFELPPMNAPFVRSVRKNRNRVEVETAA